MNYLLAMLVGVALALMITINGLLSSAVGVIEGLIIFHVVGITFALIKFKLNGEKLKDYKNIPIQFYFGGAIGAVMVTANNLCFQNLGVSLTIALILVGQIVGASLVDHFGWFGMKRVPFNIQKIGPFALMTLGILMMV